VVGEVGHAVLLPLGAMSVFCGGGGCGVDGMMVFCLAGGGGRISGDFWVVGR